MTDGISERERESVRTSEKTERKGQRGRLDEEMDGVFFTRLLCFCVCAWFD